MLVFKRIKRIKINVWYVWLRKRDEINVECKIDITKKLIDFDSVERVLWNFYDYME